MFVIKQVHFLFVIFHKGFCYYNIVCQNVLLLIKAHMDLLPQQPGFESRLAELGDIANVNKRISLLDLTFLCIRM